MLDNKKYERLIEVNKELHRQLKEAHLTIKSLQSENSHLKEKLARFESEESTVELMSQGSEEEIFTESNSSSEEDNLHGQHNFLNEEMEKINQISLQERYIEGTSIGPLSLQINKKTPPRVIFNYQSEGSPVPKVLSKNSRKDSKVVRHNSNESNGTWGNNSVDHSAIKEEEPIVFKHQNSSLFQKVKNSKKIYDNFFVAGYSFEQNSPTIEYCFPSESKHFEAIISLIYTENAIRLIENLSPGPRSPRIGSRTGKLAIKDTFMMILCKGENGEKEYLFACEADDIMEAPDKSQYLFNRLFCFITSCSFFAAFSKLIEQFVTKINTSKSGLMSLSPLLPKGAKEQLRALLEDHLKVLWEKNVEENQYVNFGLGNQINFFIDIPSASESYRNILEYQPWGILSFPVHLINEVNEGKENKLLGFLLVYALTETKIMLYSMTKSKVSEAILHMIELIKPLEYVNPIIMGTLKDEHQEYFDAPMSVIMGLWGEQKARRKQKIEIFMNKKPSLCGTSGVIEDNKINAEDGVVFNLDTGLTFGGGLKPELNRIATDLNYIFSKYCKTTKEQYRLFENLLKSRSHCENGEIKSVFEKLLGSIAETQLYSVYQDKKNLMIPI